MDASSSQEEELALDSLLTRLAMTDESRLEKVLSKLLPLVINRLSTPHEAARKKIMEILTHINKRTRDQHQIKLPLAELYQLFVDPNSASLVKNFALVYTEMAFERASPQDKLGVVSGMLTDISTRIPQHQDMLLRMVVKGLEAYGNDRGVMEDKFKDRFPFTQSPADRALFLTFALQSLLYMPPGRTPEGQPIPPPGLSLVQVNRITGAKAGASGEELGTRKLGILNFIGALELAPKSVYCHFLVASVDSNSRVARRGEELLKRKTGNVDLEDKTLVTILFNTFQGTSAKNVPPEQIVAPASPVLKARLMSSFTRSVVAANCFPSTLQCVFDCIYGPATTLRLKQAGMEFAVWIFKHASDAELKPMGQAILVGLLKLLGTLEESEGDAASKQLKAFTYQAIGQLAQRTPNLFSGNTAVAARFFGALRTEPQQLRSQLQEAVMALCSAYEGCSLEVSRQIEALLQENMYAEDQARFCAVQWATRLYPMSHAPSRFICILGAGDAKLEIREAAEKGLGLSAREREESAGTSTQPSTLAYPSLDAMICYIAERKPRLPTPSQIGEQALLLPAKTYIAALRFVHKCWVTGQGVKAAADVPEGRDVSLYQLLLEHAMARDGTTELHALAADGLLELVMSSPEHFAKVYQERIPWLRQFLGHVDMSTREAFSKIIGLTTSTLDATAASSLLQDLSSMYTVANKGRFEDMHGAICAVGYIVAQCLSGSPAVPHTTVEALSAKLCSTLSSTTVAAVTAEALGHIGLRGPIPLPVGDIASVRLLPASTPPNTPSTSSVTLEPTPAVAMAKPVDGAAGKKEGEVDGGAEEASRAVVLRRLRELLDAKDVKVVVKAVVALGHINYGDSSAEVTDAVLDGLLSLARNKNEDVLFAVGEGLAYIWGGLPSMADKVLRSNFTSLAVSSNFLMAESTTPGGDIVMKDAEGADDRGPARERIIKKLFGELLFSGRKEERCAGAVWLLSLVSYSGRHPKIQSMLPEIQEAFSHLLGDQNELTQEMASRGMSIVYELGDASTKEQLVAALVGTLSGGGSKKRAVKLMEETEVFQEGTLGELPGGGGISTYKELCNIANEMGQPDLIYKFMDLANYQASLNSKRGAAFGFAKIAQQAGDAMKPHLANLVPKLFRYQYDPNQAIQDSMGHIWRALVAEPKKAVDEHFGAIMEDLLKEVGSRLWRSREASCLALIDLVQGRKMEEVGPYLERLWNVAFRAVDDIKETVRKAGDRLCRSVSSLSIRLCDTSLTPQKDAEAAMAVVLPFLLSKGIVSPVSAVRNSAVTSIMKLAKGAGKALKPQLPELVSCMLESLSNLESSELNYLESHVRGAGISSEKLENVRISMSKDSPMWDTLDYCLQQADAASLEGLVPKLTQLVRSGVGLNTRVGTAKFITMLAQRREADVRLHVPALLRALFPVVQSERSAAGRKAFAAACASVARFATPARLGKLVEETVRLYTTPGDNDARMACALVLRELSRQAGAAVTADATTVLPLAFVGKFDAEEEVARMLGEVWEENTSGQGASLRLYADEMVALIADGMTSSSWPRKQQSAKAAVALSDGLGENLAPHAQKLLTGIVAELPGRLWEGKESVLEALGAVCKSCHAAITENSAGQTTESIVAALVVACSRRKLSYREAAFKCLEQVLKAFKQSELFSRVAPLLLDACTRTPPAPKSTAIVDNEASKQDEEENPAPPLAPSLNCLAATWDAASPLLVRESGGQVAAAIVIALGTGRPWNARVSALSAAKVFIKKLKPDTNQGPLPQKDTEFLQMLLPPVLECTEDQKFSQVRESAVECIAEVLKISDGGTLLPRDLVDAMQRRFDDLVSDRNATVKSLAMRTTELLHAPPSNMET